MLLGRKTRHGRPSPAASASEAHDPEPPPLKQADPYGAGWMPAGHARPGNESHSPPAWATARTHRMDRAASAPGRELDARKTRAPGPSPPDGRVDARRAADVHRHARRDERKHLPERPERSGPRRPGPANAHDRRRT